MFDSAYILGDSVEFVKGIGNWVDNDSQSLPHSPLPHLPHLPTPKSKKSDKWYTPPHIVDLVTQVLDAIDLDPCADEGKHIKATNHYTATEDGLSQQWNGQVFMNPPYSCPGKWIAKLQAEVKAARVTEAIALVPASTDTNWLFPLLKSQPICFWKGRIKFLDTSYQPKQSARQSHCLVYWGNNPHKFKQVFDEVGVVKNVDSWNPADFGDTSYKADGDQLTIFCEDNELPEPDDYPSISDYEQAWAEWELNNQPKDKTMTTFQFSGTSAIAGQIAQLQEQLNALTTSFRSHQECEQKAEELRLTVAEYGREMMNKGIPHDDLLNWAKSLYSAASNLEFIDKDSSVIAAQNEAISGLRGELVVAFVQRDDAIAESEKIGRESIALLQSLESKKQELKALLEQFDTATIEVLRKENASLIVKIQELETMTDDMDAQLAEQQLMPEIEVLKQQVYELQLERDGLALQLQSHTKVEASHGFGLAKESNFMTGDRVAVIDVGDDDNLEYLLGNKGTVTRINSNGVAVLFEKRIEFDEHEVVLSSRNLMLVSQPNSFITNIKTTCVMNKIRWGNISEICQGSLATFRELELSASTKVQKSFVNVDNLARLMADYILETGDTTDFGWLDDIFVAKVEALVEAKKSLAYHKGDWVRSLETGVIWQVRSFDGEWLSAILDNKITSLHKSEVKLVEIKVAA